MFVPSRLEHSSRGTVAVADGQLQRVPTRTPSCPLDGMQTEHVHEREVTEVDDARIARISDGEGRLG